MTVHGSALARAVSDGSDRLVTADDAIAALQLDCGGVLPGVIAVPALLDTVRKSRRYELKLARSIVAQSGSETVTAWVEVEPRQDGEEGCEITLRNWHSRALPPDDIEAIQARRANIDRHLAELTAILDAGQRLLAVEVTAPDLRELAGEMAAGIGRPWTDFLEIVGNSHQQPIHWRLLDGAQVSTSSSPRAWRVSLFPRLHDGTEPVGFELGLTSDEPLVMPRQRQRQASAEISGSPATQGVIGRDVAPVLRQPIARIIANAETIRTRLAGPLADEYSDYAADIAAAGQHLLALLDDLSDLEVVESDEFQTAPDRIDLGDVARRAAGILGVRAREHGIVLVAPQAGEALPAIAEFRRVLQILLNLLGNAVRYSPANSQVWIRLKEEAGKARLVVADQGPGLSAADQAKVFEKFERLGRSGDGGSGLGLYISRRLARAMGGELSVESSPGQGARFILDLPRDFSAAAAG